MSEIVFRVRAVPGGWMVLNGAPVGSVMDKESALDLAEGMAVAIRQTGAPARVIVEARLAGE